MWALNGPWPEDGFTVSLDMPTAHTLKFMSNGDIRVWPPGVVIGAYEPGVNTNVEIDLNIPAGQWVITLDGDHAYTGSVARSTRTPGPMVVDRVTRRKN